MKVAYQGRPRGCAPSPPSPAIAAAGPCRCAPGVGSQILGQAPPEPSEVCASFDGKYEAFVQNFNVFLKPKGDQPAYPISFDGSEDNHYSLRSFAWSPDSKKLVAYHTRPGYDRQVTYIESSPADQIQPKHSTIHYAKPGDTLDIAYPVLFDVATKQQTEIDHTLFPEPVRHQHAGLVEGQPRLYLRVQPARPSGLHGDRGRCDRPARRGL